ncbi:capsule biosynthesis protein [Swaminathania salitolerans]|nr:capsule biosynthesis protein [Swaminathania salitolerans]
MSFLQRLYPRTTKAKLFYGTVIAPTFVTALYLYLVASPQYISETHFLVRGSQNHSLPSLANVMEGSLGGGASENTYAVQDYMVSRDAMDLLRRELHLEQIYNRKGADFIARYPAFFLHKTMESFYWYYKRHIKVVLDADTSLSVLRVRSFSAEDSQKIANALLQASEKLVNEMNARQRENLIGAAQKEVNDTLHKIQELQKQLAAYQNRNSLIDPQKQSVSLISTEYALQTMLSSTQMHLQQVQKTSPDSPSTGVLKNQIDILKEQLAAVRSQITGASNSLVPKLMDFDTLTIRRQLLEKILASEVASLESAKAQADRQMIFLEEVTQPNLPDYAEYPPNIEVLLIVFATLGMVFLMISLLVSGAREHSAN